MRNVTKLCQCHEKKLIKVKVRIKYNNKSQLLLFQIILRKSVFQKKFMSRVL